MNLPDVKNLNLSKKTHRYILRQGQHDLFLPSVTTIIKFLSQEFYGRIDRDTLQKAAERGTRVHEAIELIDMDCWVPEEEDTAGYVAAYRKWRDDYKPEILATEWRGYHQTMFYAGTLDKIIKLPDVSGLVIVDMKTTSTYTSLLVDTQLAGYTLLLESWPGIKVSSTWGLQLKPDGSYRFEKTKDPLKMKTYFSMCFALYGAVQKEMEG